MIAQTDGPAAQPPARLLIVGSAAVDISSQATDSEAADATLGQHSTSPGIVSVALGGVGRNIAEAAHRILSVQPSGMSNRVMLVSVIGEDTFGRIISDEMDSVRMRIDGLVKKAGTRSAVCNMILDAGGSLTRGIADMDNIKNLRGDEVSPYCSRC